jgi:hypothetical protein
MTEKDEIIVICQDTIIARAFSNKKKNRKVLVLDRFFTIA